MIFYCKGQLRVVPLKRLLGARMVEKPAATFEVYWIPLSPQSDRTGELKTIQFTSSAGHAAAVALCDAIDCWIQGVPSGST